jgi:F0F1-type ATP synthase membrane subunit b/b'
MVVFFTAFIFLLAGGEGGFMHFYEEYLNIPGFELWKFLNLAIFIGLMIYVLKTPLGDAFKAKREEIRAELIKAEAEKQTALTKLTAAEGKLAQLENEKANILQRAKDEYIAEIKRDDENSNIEIERLRRQSEVELTRLTAQSRAALRRFSAEESIRLAEEKLRSMIDGEKDARLVKAGIEEIGGLN